MGATLAGIMQGAVEGTKWQKTPFCPWSLVSAARSEAHPWPGRQTDGGGVQTVELRSQCQGPQVTSVVARHEPFVRAVQPAWAVVWRGGTWQVCSWAGFDRRGGTVAGVERARVWLADNSFPRKTRVLRWTLGKDERGFCVGRVRTQKSDLKGGQVDPECSPLFAYPRSQSICGSVVSDGNVA